jgi:hypothetical protein
VSESSKVEIVNMREKESVEERVCVEEIEREREREREYISS